METFLLAALLVVLMTIAVELFLLIRRIDARPAPHRRDTEGATIQVNVGTLPPGVQTSVSAPTPQTEAVPVVAETSEPEVPPEPEPEPPRTTARTAVSPRRMDTTPNGLGIVKCPKCGSENSNFRKECFRCEARL